MVQEEAPASLIDWSDSCAVRTTKRNGEDGEDGEGGEHGEHGEHMSHVSHYRAGKNPRQVLSLY